MIQLNRVKDSIPQVTIKRCQKILTKLGITVEEKWFETKNYFYSVNLRVNGTTVCVNGKGTTKEFALASGYGELFERLQNQCLIFQNFPFHLLKTQERKFYVAPDEVWSDFNSFKEHFSELYPTLDMSYEYVFDCLVKVQQKENGKKLLELPFQDVMTNKTKYVPKAFIDMFIGTNGMCAGNTKSEAIVQGLSEIAERFVIRESLFPSYRAKIYNASCYTKLFPSVLPLLQVLSEKTDSNIFVVDYSIDFSLPVLGVLYVDTKEHKYLFNHGAHPNIQVALERCLTELLQGQNLDSFNYLVGFNLSDVECSSIQNLKALYLDRRGRYYPQIFDFNYIDDPQKNVFSVSTKNLVLEQELCTRFKQRGDKMLIRDCSYLGIPSFLVVIPRVSELFRFNKKNLTMQANDLAFKNKIPDYLNLISKNSPCKIKEYSSWLQYIPIEKHLKLPLCETSNSIGKLPTIFLNIWAALINRNYIEAEKQITNLLTIKRNKDDYLFEMLQILRGLNKSYSLKKLKKIIGLFYKDISLIEDVLIGKVEGVPFLSCPNCSSCSLSQMCKGDEFVKIQLKLDNLYLKFWENKNGRI